jgi:hypothetical protein
VREESEPFAPARGFSLSALPAGFAAVLGDRAGDGVVQTAIQRAKFVDRDRCVSFERQFGDGLTMSP